VRQGQPPAVGLPGGEAVHTDAFTLLGEVQDGVRARRQLQPVLERTKTEAHAVVPCDRAPCHILSSSTLAAIVSLSHLSKFSPAQLEPSCCCNRLYPLKLHPSQRCSSEADKGGRLECMCGPVPDLVHQRHHLLGVRLPQRGHLHPLEAEPLTPVPVPSFPSQLESTLRGGQVETLLHFFPSQLEHLAGG